MRTLMDTHAFLWWLTDSSRLSRQIHRTIMNPANSKLVSAATAWEITTKHRLGKLPGTDAIALDVQGVIEQQGFEELPIALSDAAKAGALPGPLRDPFDRMLIAQAQAHNLPLISNETIFDQYGIRRLW